MHYKIAEKSIKNRGVLFLAREIVSNPSRQIIYVGLEIY